jgi:hypothetical protein
MKTKPLIETNPYMKDPVLREKFISRSVRTSCGVEGIKAPPDNVMQFKIPRRKDKKIYKSRATK